MSEHRRMLFPQYETLFTHIPHPHAPHNVNEQHADEQEHAGINARLAVTITRATGTMFCAYLFACIALLGFPALISLVGPIVALYVVWVSQTFIQLCMLPILSVGQTVLGRHAELQATEQYLTTMKTYHEIEQIILHLSEQDKELLRQTALLIELQRRTDAK